MKARKTLSVILALALMFSVIAPCSSVVRASEAQITLYDGKFEQVTEPAIGESYYLGANVGGTLKYFTHGTVTSTTPNSLVVTDDVASAQQVVIEDPSAVEESTGEGFQLTYPNPNTSSSTKTLRIHCFGTAGAENTGAAAQATKGRTTFLMEDLDGLKILRKTGNNNILVVKQLTHTDKTTVSYRMQGVPVEELANDGVYPVMLLKEHEHSYTNGGETLNTATKTASRTCTTCGYTAVVHGQAQEQVTNPIVGETYYLAANVNGTLKYFVHGAYSQTSPNTLVTTEAVESATPIVIEDPTAVQESDGTGFQLSYTHPTEGKTNRIYCVGTTTKTGADAYKNRNTFKMDMVNGVSVLRKHGNNTNVLVAKEVVHTDGTTKSWRITGVADTELANEGVYPVMLSVAHEHTYGDTWIFDEENGTQSHLCTVCGFAGETLHGTDTKASMVTDYEIGGTYYLGANVGGTLKFFTHGTATDTTPNSLVVTDNVTRAQRIELEDPSAVAESTGEGFQMIYPNPDTSSATTTLRIHCMGTGAAANTAAAGQATKGRNTFVMDEVNGMKVLRKTANNNILVVKYNETKGAWRLLGVPEAELANEGVYPAMLMTLHEHAFGEELYSEADGHYHLCDCESKSDVVSHSFGDWTLDRENQKQTATCEVCDYELTVASPYLDTVDSLEELTNGLGETVQVDGTYTVTGGKDYYLMAEIGDDFYYFRNVGKTAGGNAEGTSSTVTETAGHSLYTTNDPSHDNIIKAKVTPGNTENTYVIYAGKNIGRVVYIRNEGTDENVDTGLTAFNGVSTNAIYKARSEFEWDEENGCLYQMEGDVKYVLVMKQMTASYNSGTETGTEWRMVGVPVAQATPEQGNYPVVLVNHVHNLSKNFQKEGNTYYRACGCGYHATVDAGIVLGESLGVNFDVKLEESETVTATVDGKEAPVLLTENGTKYSAFVPLSAAQMTDAVKICVGGDVLDVAFTVRSFADAVLADESYNQYAKDLVNHMLVYGSAAQNYFDHNTGDLAGEGVDVTVTMPEKTAGVAVQSDLEGVEFYGASVVHEGRTAVRFYFTADSVDGLTFTVDGNVYEPAQKDGMYYIEVAGINPQNLDQDMTALVTNGQQNLAVQYSPLTYITRTYHRADAPAVLKELVKAMYGYHKATKTYIANMYLGNDFALKSQTKTSLYDGVDQYASTYVAAGEGEVKAYSIVISEDANVELKVSAGEWSESSTAENPGGTKTVVKHFRDMKSAGNNVLAMINGGFFDLNTGKTMKPYGMQIVDGVVKQAPSAGTNSDNWFGMTKDGKYVISNAEGYANTYVGNIQQGVGGGKLLMIDKQVQNLTSDRDYRTAVGVNADGDLVLVAVENATYNDICQIFVDLNMDIVTVLNLDGGGSTAMYVPGAFYPKALILGEDGLLPREVADAVGAYQRDLLSPFHGQI